MRIFSHREALIKNIHQVGFMAHSPQRYRPLIGGWFFFFPREPNSPSGSFQPSLSVVQAVEGLNSFFYCSVRLEYCPEPGPEDNVDGVENKTSEDYLE